MSDPPAPLRDELDVVDLKPPPLDSGRTYKCPALCARFTQGALVLNLLVALAGSALTALQFTLIFLDEQGASTAPILWEINAQGWDYIGDVTQIFFLVTAATFSRWLYRVASNAVTLNPRGLRDTPAMCLIWYFVPFANLVKPYQSMKAINAVSSSHGRFSASRLLPWWWGLWLLTAWVEQIFEVIWQGAETNLEIMKVSAFYEVTYLGECVLTILAIIIVRRITSAQKFHVSPEGLHSPLRVAQTPL